MSSFWDLLPRELKKMINDYAAKRCLSCNTSNAVRPIVCHICAHHVCKQCNIDGPPYRSVHQGACQAEIEFCWVCSQIVPRFLALYAQDKEYYLHTDCWVRWGNFHGQHFRYLNREFYWTHQYFDTGQRRRCRIDLINQQNNLKTKQDLFLKQVRK